MFLICRAGGNPFLWTYGKHWEHPVTALLTIDGRFPSSHLTLLINHNCVFEILNYGCSRCLSRAPHLAIVEEFTVNYPGDFLINYRGIYAQFSWDLFVGKWWTNLSTNNIKNVDVYILHLLTCLTHGPSYLSWTVSFLATNYDTG